MRSRAGLAVAAVFAALAFVAAADDYDTTMEALTRDLPEDAADIVYRIVDCKHWEGEEPYDDERQAAIEEAMEELQCEQLAADVADLRQRYKGQADVLRALDIAKELEF